MGTTHEVYRNEDRNEQEEYIRPVSDKSFHFSFTKMGNIFGTS
jgi:hypothetical protein